MRADKAADARLPFPWAGAEPTCPVGVFARTPPVRLDKIAQLNKYACPTNKVVKTHVNMPLYCFFETNGEAMFLEKSPARFRR
ncbi:hypothetical protein M3221_21420 [Domibacillus indicus]|uniref:hypothetical protein n=1 Tax=Domibacillus indicus TaxID=1437523 RepID=UPI00203C710C|nr:hypothetical protein [Domibacillus indicus]MCM3790906.1 hypothetical protein [Domibacillus indicus]